MNPRFDLQQDLSEPEKILALLGLQRVFLEERYDSLKEVIDSTNSIRHSITVVSANHATTEMGFEGVKHVHIPFVLNDGELRKYLNSRFHFGMFVDPDVEATFTVHESGDPLSFEIHQPAPNIKSLRVLVV
jgi:hypothetical protein